MTLREAVYNTLVAVTNITDITSTRIHWKVMPQDTDYPAIVFETVPTIEGRIHLMTADSALVMETLRVTVWGEEQNLLNMELVAGYIKTALSRFSGVMGGDGGVTINQIFLNTNQSAIYEAGVNAYNIPQDFTVWYQE